MSSNYNKNLISVEEARVILKDNYNLTGILSPLPGEMDFNFKVKTAGRKYILKVSRPEFDPEFIDFHVCILETLSGSKIFPITTPTLSDKPYASIKDKNGLIRIVRLLSWIPGRLWSEVNPINDDLRFNLGEKAGGLTALLSGFNHDYADRSFEWDISQATWIEEYLNLFDDEKAGTIKKFIDLFKEIQPQYSGFRKSVVHNDVNDNNIVVSNNLRSPEVLSIIDFGDAVYTQTINDLAITIAYGIMGQVDILDASLPIIAGYHKKFPIYENELDALYVLVAIRLCVSVTKSAINKKDEPDNKYLQISDDAAWEALLDWSMIDQNFALYSFRSACGYEPHPAYQNFVNWSGSSDLRVEDMFKELTSSNIVRVDMSMGSNWLGHEKEFNDNDLLNAKLKKLSADNNQAIPAGGYLEPRPIYTTDEYIKEGNSGPEYRSVHLGIDFWLPEYTGVYSLFDGEVILARIDEGDKEYGGLLILRHEYDGITFYTLYGHQTVASVLQWTKGDKIKTGEKLCELGPPSENGNWASHLHFQIMLDMLGNEHEFPGVTYPDQLSVWRSICPDPNLIFKEKVLEATIESNTEKILSMRSKTLGSSLSLSYKKPLHIVRGSGAYLFDFLGRKYLDTVNNVAHVGHENYRVVNAGIEQMKVLNTNTRYLHSNITDFAEEILSTLPTELSVVHFVNSGSEANELALRMARTYTGSKDVIAVEVGYHGNTSGCIEVSSYKFDGKGGTGAPENTHIVPLPDTFRGLYTGYKAGLKYADHVKETIDKLKKEEKGPASFICESIISCGGQIELPESFLSESVKAIRNEGGVYIADEVQVGCGRTGKYMWGFQFHDVIPDIVTIGKPIGNGHPLAVVVCTQEIASCFANGMEYFNTFGGNPVSCSIGLEVLKTINDDNLQNNALIVGEYLKSRLEELMADFPIIGDVRGQGLFLGFELVNSNNDPLTTHTTYLSERMKEYGVLMSVDGKDNNVIKIKPPIIFNKSNADELIKRLESVLSEDYLMNYDEQTN